MVPVAGIILAVVLNFNVISLKILCVLETLVLISSAQQDDVGKSLVKNKFRLLLMATESIISLLLIIHRIINTHVLLGDHSFMLHQYLYQ